MLSFYKQISEGRMVSISITASWSNNRCKPQSNLSVVGCVCVCDVTSGDPPPGAARPSPLLEQSPASRSVSGPRRSLRMRVDRLESFSKLITAENHCVNGRKTTTWAGSVPLTRVILSADIPRTEKRRRVSVQHKGVSQGLRIISRRSKSPFSPDFLVFMVPCCHTRVCIFSPWSGICELWCILNPCERRPWYSKQWIHRAPDRGRWSELPAENNHTSAVCLCKNSPQK